MTCYQLSLDNSELEALLINYLTEKLNLKKPWYQKFK